ncbi:MAG: 4'-phosphopantetheinyl transferase superfamily protein [Flavobacterium sp.]|nr:4'-phosphopantetheinyl transferase superfamily protein [Flavobacterium sp.]
MIGNDIIDLERTRIESNWKRKRFLEKLFTENEQKIIFLSENPEVMVWNLWSRKEAAYKIYHRQTKNRVFIPKRIECDKIKLQKEHFFGLVTIEGLAYVTRTEVTSGFIYTEATLHSNDFQSIQPIHSSHIFKDQYGIPHAKFSNNPVSITHHGAHERRIQLNINAQSRF